MVLRSSRGDRPRWTASLAALVRKGPCLHTRGLPRGPSSFFALVCACAATERLRAAAAPLAKVGEARSAVDEQTCSERQASQCRDGALRAAARACSGKLPWDCL